LTGLLALHLTRGDRVHIGSCYNAGTTTIRKKSTSTFTLIQTNPTRKITQTPGVMHSIAMQTSTVQSTQLKPLLSSSTYLSLQTWLLMNFLGYLMTSNSDSLWPKPQTCHGVTFMSRSTCSALCQNKTSTCVQPSKQSQNSQITS